MNGWLNHDSASTWHLLEAFPGHSGASAPHTFPSKAVNNMGACSKLTIESVDPPRCLWDVPYPITSAESRITFSQMGICQVGFRLSYWRVEPDHHNQRVRGQVLPWSCMSDSEEFGPCCINFVVALDVPEISNLTTSHEGVESVVGCHIPASD